MRSPNDVRRVRRLLLHLHRAHTQHTCGSHKFAHKLLPSSAAAAAVAAGARVVRVTSKMKTTP